MQIVTVLFGSFPNSAEGHRMILMLKGLMAAGDEVHVICPRRVTPGPLYEEIEGVKVHWGANSLVQNTNGLTDKLIRHIIAFRQLRILLRNGSKALIIRSFDLVGYCYSLLAKLHKCAVIADFCELPHIFEHSIYKQLLFRLNNYFRQFILRNADIVIVVSKVSEEYALRYSLQKNQVYLPLLVDTGQFITNDISAEQFRMTHNIRNLKVISYFGSFHVAEGIDVLLLAVQKLLQEGLQFETVLAGVLRQGKDRTDVPALINELGISDLVHYVGCLKTEEVISGMAASDILVISKRDNLYNNSGFPQKFAEYLSVGKTIVTTKVSDMPRYIVDGENGILCEPDSVESLAEALKRALNDDSLRLKLSRNAVKVAKDNFDHVVLGSILHSRLIELGKNR